MNGKGPPGPRAEAAEMSLSTAHDRRRRRLGAIAENPPSRCFGQASGRANLANALTPAAWVSLRKAQP
jgi:hypothetical protein